MHNNSLKKVLVATSNRGKLLEIQQILRSVPLELISMDEYFDSQVEIEETGSTFEENALIKAQWVYNKSGLWALADDSGLEVDALGGKPGVLSARFAGVNAGTEENNRKLLNELENISASDRSARFRCVLVLKTAPDSYLCSEGVCEGHIGFEPRGSNGFGYDPLFIPEGLDRTFAQLSSEEKHLLSHRAKALKSLLEKLNVLPL
ncbi:MAG: RdgB/HAM1 family non-canonical purine NTP pyrophosphatase [Fibrobacter sp.]|jgi:XTP/dITP diphosphohydrolase|nr:RdgB/HAM1 family non-canonical purine NTP pyrophosphatase [Fibrobacter sp.]